MSQQDIVDGIKDAPSTFSSWDKCMAKTYCKWPVIVIIIVGVIIAISVIWCVARCLCCGAECVCCCFKCCAGCCGSGRRKSPDRTGDVLPNSYNTPYQSHPSPAYAPGGFRSTTNAYEPPQYARFDTPTSKPINEDALPAMPSWGDAKSHRIEDDTHEDVELKPLAPNGEHVAAAMPIASPAGRSPVQSPSENGYFTGQQPHQNPYGGGYHAGPYRPQNSRQNTNQSGYGRGQDYQDQSPGYGNGHGFRQEAGYRNDNAYGQESGVHHDQHQQYGGDYNDRNQAYANDPYARQTSPYQPPRSPYQTNDHNGYGYQPQPVQPVQQGGWHTRQPINDNGWKEV